MLPHYKVIFRDTSGDKVAQFAGRAGELGGLTGIRYTKKVNKVGTHAVTIKGDTSIADLVDLDYFVEIQRRPLGLLDWSTDYIGLHRTWVWQADAVGNEIFTSHGFDLKHLLARRVIAYAVGEAEALKSGLSEVVAKEYVDENCGPSAAAARQFSDFTIAATTGVGVTWDGDRARQVLLDVLQEIAEDGGDFDIIWQEDASGNYTGVQFVWYYPQFGTDRTAGNDNQVIFSTERNNMLVPVSSYNRSKEINYVYVLGQGQGAARVVREVSDSDLMDDSPWNRMEVVRQASNETTNDGLDRAGDEALEASKPIQGLNFQVRQTDGTAYGVHYFLGDIVTGIYEQTVEKRIAEVSINVAEKGESIAVKLSDVSRIR